MNKRNFIANGASLAAVTLLGAGCTTTGGSSADPAAQRQAIDAAADSALSRLYQQVGGSRDLAASSRGMLVVPTFVSAGFVVGGTSGTEVMRKGG